LRHGQRWVVWAGVGVLSGLLVNMHPLSGIAVLAGLLTAEGVRMFAGGQRGAALARHLLVGLAGAVVGALPLLLSSTSVEGGPPIGIESFRQALALRVPSDHQCGAERQHGGGDPVGAGPYPCR
jgi:hypothetical protein